MRISSSYMSQQALDVMLNQQSELGKTQLKITTGKNIMSPSDDPVGAIKILDLQRQLNLTGQYLDNSNTADNKLSVSEQLLTSSTDILQKIRELAVQGLNSALEPGGQKAIAEEIDQLNQSLLGIANTKDSNEEYIFSGYETDVEPFSSVTSGYVPASPGAGDGQRQIRVSEGYSVKINEPGNQVFEASHDTVAAGQSVFQTINDFVADLNANTVGTASANGDVLNNIDSSLDTILSARTRIGSRMNAVDQQRDINDGIKYSSEKMLSQVEDLDYASAISELNLQMTGLSAAQQAFVKVQGLSLFNYL